MGSPRDQDWDAQQRHETSTERLDRNWTDLLQELRVTQTGVQLLTGFLLTLPFQARFSGLSNIERDVYLATVVLAVGASCLLIAPVALHRALFRRHARRITVELGHRLAIGGTALFGLAVTGVVLLIFTVVAGGLTGTIVGVLVFVLLATLWLGLPSYLRASEAADGGHGRAEPSE